MPGYRADRMIDCLARGKLAPTAGGGPSAPRSAGPPGTKFGKSRANAGLGPYSPTRRALSSHNRRAVPSSSAAGSGRANDLPTT